MPNKYQGLILPGRFRKDSVLTNFVDPFIQHFRFGHHKQFGKDTLFWKPPEIRPYHLRKVHVDMGFYRNDKGEGATQACWVNWASGRIDSTTGKRKTTPTSDVYLIYLVTSERDAILVDFWGPPSSAHQMLQQSQQMDKLVVECERIMELKKQQPMPRDAELWSTDFLI